MNAPDRIGHVNELLRLASEGDRVALDELIGVVYAELRSIAKARRGQWRGDQTMSTTALVSEAYLRLAAQEGAQWQNRDHFFAVASRAMRQILLDYARRRGAQKRGGEWDRVTLEKVDHLFPGLNGLPSDRAETLIELDACLVRLEEESSRHCRIVECRFFGGMTIEETAKALDISTATVKRGWTAARAWLHRELSGA